MEVKQHMFDRRWLVAGIALAAGSLVAGAFVLPSLPDLEPSFDLLIVGATVYDGSGGPPLEADVAVRGNRIVQVGSLADATARKRIDASGLAVAPGFINAHSWATGSLLRDGRSLSNLKQGVTTEVFGEGVTMGPLNDALITKYGTEEDRDYPPPGYPIEWRTLRDYLTHLESKGVTPNVASFVGATTVREFVLGAEDRAPTGREMKQMKGLVDRAMREGALGLGSRLAYAPASYASTEELTALATVAAKHGGRYVSHIRSEGSELLPALEEFFAITENAGLPGTIYHLKAAGARNWSKLDRVIVRVEDQRSKGHDVTATVYPYRAGSTGLDACLPPWVHEGGPDSLRARLRDPGVRKRMAEQMTADSLLWEDYCRLSGSPDNVLLVEFHNPDLQHLQGQTLAEVAERRNVSPSTAIMDLVLEDKSLVQTVFFMMSEENVRKKIRLPWVFFGSDAPSVAAEGEFLDARVHPRAYGTFARVLGRYVREEGLISLQEAVRRMTSLPADQFRLSRRGRLSAGYFADVVVFDPSKIEDRTTYEEPHRYAEGMVHVFVNGTQVLRAGKHTGELPGRALQRGGH